MRPRARCILLLLLSAACGDMQAPDIPVDTTFSDCASAEDLAGGVIQQSSEDRVGSSALLYENTVYLLLGRAGCVWARSGGILDPVHARRLTAAERLGLEQRLDIATWASLGGLYEGNLFDGSPYLFWDGHTSQLTILCGAACTGGSVPPAVVVLADTYREERIRFAKEEPAYAGHVRFTVVRDSEGVDRRDPLPWPLNDVRASNVALETTDPRVYQFGNGLLTSTPKQAALLRWLRGQFIARPDLSNGRTDIPVVERGVRYSVLVRDAVPIENSEGRVPFP